MPEYFLRNFLVVILLSIEKDIVEKGMWGYELLKQHVVDTARSQLWIVPNVFDQRLEVRGKFKEEKCDA
jgi:hypothetical protein